MKTWICACMFLGAAATAWADMSVSPWVPMFKGIDHATGTNFGKTIFTNNNIVYTNSRVQAVHCMRVDLTDPDVQFFTTPPATNFIADSQETLSLTITNYLKNFGVQVGLDSNFYYSHPNGSDPPSEYYPCDVWGLLICTGQVVSVADNTERYATLMFTTNKQPILNFNNRPPGVDTTGIFTSVTGFYPVVSNGINIGPDAVLNYPDNSGIHDPNPRTTFGISQDKRYLFLMVIDGRQGPSQGIRPTYSEGALDVETGLWMLQFGAWDAISMDGGNSSALYVEGCDGNPVRMNHSSYLAARGVERNIGCHFGVFARPAPQAIEGVTVQPGIATATVAWKTRFPSTSQVDYGLTEDYGSTITDSMPLTQHRVILHGLRPLTSYFYRVSSSDGNTNYTFKCDTFFTTTSSPPVVLLALTNDWTFSTNDLSGFPWQTLDYDDSDWTGPLPGVFWVDTTYTDGGNPAIQFLPLATLLPHMSPTYGSYPFPVYYFRTHFNLTNSPAGATLVLSNYIDDGAAFYLNGNQIGRAFLRDPGYGTPFTYPTSSCPTFNATCPYVFALTNDLATNLVSGNNLLAVEVHNYLQQSPDITFGSSVFLFLPDILPPLHIQATGTSTTIAWDGSGFTLQESQDLGDGAHWTDIEGSITNSLQVLTNPVARAFYRLRN